MNTHTGACPLRGWQLTILSRDELFPSSHFLWQAVYDTGEQAMATEKHTSPDGRLPFPDCTVEFSARCLLFTSIAGCMILMCFSTEERRRERTRTRRDAVAALLPLVLPP